MGNGGKWWLGGDGLLGGWVVVAVVVVLGGLAVGVVVMVGR